MPRKATGAATGSNPNKARDPEKMRQVRASHAGRPKGSTNKITAVAQISALQKELGIPFEDAVAKTAGRLYRDFLIDKNVREWIDVMRHLSNKLTQPIPQEIILEDNIKDLPIDEVKSRLIALQQKLLQSRDDDSGS
jgi:hypothetical protein